MSNFFKDVSKLNPVKNLIIFYRKIYSVFRNGLTKGPYAIFMEHAKLENFGRPIGLIRPAETRFAGFFLALHRMLRLKTALQQTVLSQPFQDANVTDKEWIVHAISRPEMWFKVYHLLKALFPMLQLLRVADSKEPGMDKAYFYICHADKALMKSEEMKNKKLST